MPDKYAHDDRHLQRQHAQLDTTSTYYSLLSVPTRPFKMPEHFIRPQTPQAMLHRLPDKPSVPSTDPTNNKPSTYIILIVASTAVAGKVQIANSVADALACPLFQGDSLHETSARAASHVGIRTAVPARNDGSGQGQASVEPNRERYQRMWLSKMTRIGHLFPGESRPATEGFSGFGGGAPAPVFGSTSASSSRSNVNSLIPTGAILGTTTYVHKPPPTAALSEDKKLRSANPALMVVTHPVLEQWHKDSIRHVVGEHGIGVVFVPLDEDQELPALKPLDPRTMTNFASLGSFGNAKKVTVGTNLDDEIVLVIDTKAKVEDLIEDIILGVQDIMSA